jgi:hypothetical protein
MGPARPVFPHVKCGTHLASSMRAMERVRNRPTQDEPRTGFEGWHPVAGSFSRPQGDGGVSDDLIDILAAVMAIVVLMAFAFAS